MSVLTPSEIQQCLLNGPLSYLVIAASQSFPRLEGDDIKDFTNSTSTRQRPTLIKNVAQRWSAFKNWDFDYFKKKFGHILVTTNIYSKLPNEEITLEVLTDRILNHSTYSNYLQEWWYEIDCPELAHDFSIPECFQDDFSLTQLGFRNSNIWIGPAGAVTNIHQDEARTDFWSTQIRGVKRWVLVSPNFMSAAQSIHNTNDLAKLLNDKLNLTYVIDVHPGEILYVPALWWHATQALEPNITLRNVYVPPEQIKNYVLDTMSIPIRLALQGDEIGRSNAELHDQLLLLSQKLKKLLYES
jgi:hypothetical protein